MQSDYPLSRCPACKKAFRMEISRHASQPPLAEQTLSPPPNLWMIVCPHCGLKFRRFDPQYLAGTAARSAAAR
jgi:DNA-directed RNA polymerase subunit RPC12/RpoP